MHNVKRNIRIFLFILVMNLLLFPVNSSSLAISKICGYIVPDIDLLNSEIRSGFKIKIVGTNASTNSDSNGYFEITDFQSTSGMAYTLEITKDGYLKREIKDIEINSSIFLGSGATPIYMWAGDIAVKGAQDNSININDVIQMAISFNSTKGSINYNTSCDFDLDGAINIKDVVTISRHFNMTGDKYGSIEIKVLEDERPPAPDNLKYSWCTGTTVALDWVSLGNNISVYEVYINDKLVCTTTNKSIVCTGLESDSDNTIYVKAVNEKGTRSLSSNILNIKAPEDDYGNTIETATPIECEKEIIGGFQGSGDVDYFKLIPQNSGTFILKKYIGTLYSCKIVDSNNNELSYSGDYEYNLVSGNVYYVIIKNILNADDYGFIIRQKSTKPDLIFDEVKYNLDMVGVPVTFNVHVRNIGDAISKGSFRVSFDIDGDAGVIWADCKNDIKVGETVSLNITAGKNGETTWTPQTVGVHNVIIHIDSDNQIDEVIESNNFHSYTIHIDDYPNRIETAKEIKIGEELKGSLGNNMDKDYFYFEPEKSGFYRIQLPGTKFTNVYLLDAGMNQVYKTTINYNSERKRLGCYVEGNLEANRKYFIEIEPANAKDFVFENYTLSIFEVQ
ncbi:CARDB domain-containing protein [Pseudobacteroides cellulosolvens]|uniref:APHP domain protein n=1 Tax=Pseudobacteroides cellulosolvens ATCC 35603 = DSM 2933 TaxID=398512 RepID=A0A0L6JXY3_9FIRM|nr:CARDB domain-containing protein [Pseudobacteroides cellulosolvens]KNY30420.1 APHP domain protein [Pseudobacteroides cellulosolvens ATCC 35603 = DSM 2933]